MTLDCDRARELLAARGTAPEAQPDEAAALEGHLTGCQACAALRRRYEALVATCDVAFAHHVDAEAERRLAMATGAPEGGSEEYRSAVEAMRRAVHHAPSDAAAAAFVQAAHAQRDATGSGGTSAAPRRWRLALALAAAVLLTIGVGVGVSLQGPSVSDSSTSAPPPEAGLRIASHSGDVLLDDSPLGAAPGRIDGAGTSVATGEASHAHLRDPDNAELTLVPDTQVEIVAWSGQDTRLVLRSGTLRAKVRRRGPDARFEVRTENARLTVVGTEFLVRYTDGGTTVVKGTSGKVRVERRDGTLAGIVTAGVEVRVEPTPQVVALAAEPGPSGMSEPAAVEPAFAEPEAPEPGPGALLAARAAPSRPTPVARAPRPGPPVLEGAAPATGDSQPASAGPGQLADRSPASAGPGQLADRSPKPEPEVAPPGGPPPAPTLGHARTLLAEGDAHQAIAVLLEIDPGDWRRDALLGDAFQIAGQHRRARAAYRSALSRVEGDPGPLVEDLATLEEVRLRDLPSATATWSRYLRSHPGGSAAARAHLSLGRLAVGRKDHSTAEAHLRTVLASSPRSEHVETALTLLGQQLIRAERWSDAEVVFAPYADEGAGPGAEVALVGLARVRIAQGDAAAAHRLIARYWKRFPSGVRGQEVQQLERALTPSGGR